MITLSEKKEKSCFVFGAGDKTPLYRLPSDNDIVIAADGGLSYLKELDIAPDYVIGDFDSLGRIPDFNRERLKLLPCEKDTTDTHEAIMAGIDMGCTAFHIYGGTGGRLDHTLANIQLLTDLSEKGYRAFLYGEGYGITALTNGKTELEGEKGNYISVFSASDISVGVTLKNLKYTLTDGELRNNFPRGVSNEFTGETAELSVKKGTLIIYYTL